MSENVLATETETHIPGEKKSRVITWYRTPLSKETMKELHERSDLLGGLQTFGYLGLLVATGVLTVYAAAQWPWWCTALLFFMHSTFCAFTINGVHELGHGTVFKTRWLNGFFEHVLAFIGWINHKWFDVSHVRHHQYTLHQPDDLEVTLPARLSIRDVLKYEFFNVMNTINAVKGSIQRARGVFEGEWSNFLFPETDPEKRRPSIRWAQAMLAGHGLILVVSLILVATGRWWALMIPMVTSFWRVWGEGLFVLCNLTQHIGLRDDVPDFRLCCRTIYLNPVLQFLYWHMNYHIEHHMYAAVPCYRLGKLHRLIQHDLPPINRGLVPSWTEIARIQRRQKDDPKYQFEQVCPPAKRAAAAAQA
jgi:fatty acid desaturase